MCSAKFHCSHAQPVAAAGQGYWHASGGLLLAGYYFPEEPIIGYLSFYQFRFSLYVGSVQVGPLPHIHDGHQLFNIISKAWNWRACLFMVVF